MDAIVLTFSHSSVIDAPVSRVWQFHERPDILQILTPPWQPVTVVRREGGLGVGAETEFRLHFGAIAIPWLARHSHCEENRLFIDEQIEGPLSLWIHRHEFGEEGGKTRLSDRISYELPASPWSEWLVGWFVEERLRDMFRYRHQVTKRECEK